jgi:hypothetical protein
MQNMRLQDEQRVASSDSPSTLDDYSRGRADGMREMAEAACKLCANPYSDEVACLGGDEPSEVCEKISNAICRAAAAKGISLDAKQQKEAARD